MAEYRRRDQVIVTTLRDGTKTYAIYREGFLAGCGVLIEDDKAPSQKKVDDAIRDGYEIVNVIEPRRG